MLMWFGQANSRMEILNNIEQNGRVKKRDRNIPFGKALGIQLIWSWERSN
jgi:hypothetical protein